ncbi:MAG: hypothetical protein WC781_02340 [Candidatus Pacearchaeota archaeon]|jgi:hypothetical protein
MKIKNLVIGLAIMILASFVAIYGIKTFYAEEPQYDTYCGNVTYPGYEINTSEQCMAFGGKWNSNEGIYGKYPSTPSGYCDLTYNCQKQFEEAQKSYSKNLFIITVPVGVVLIAIGGALFALEAVGVGIMLGGIVTLIYGASSYWPSANNAFKFGISLAGLIIIIILAYWLNQREFFTNLFKKEKKAK